jgi:hypothetical protein
MLSLLPLVCGLQVCSRSQVACLTPQFGLRVPVSVAAAIYERAEGDTGEVDVARVNELLEERAELREARDFAAADEVRDELKEMGVTILDRDQKWFFGDRPASFGDKNSALREPPEPRVSAPQFPRTHQRVLLPLPRSVHPSGGRHLGDRRREGGGAAPGAQLPAAQPRVRRRRRGAQQAERYGRACA